MRSLESKKWAFVGMAVLAISAVVFIILKK